MARSALLRAAVFITALVFALSPATALKVDVSEFDLANGMKVVVIPDHRAPVVTHMVWYKVGAADEEKGKAGIAHFLEHLLFKGTKKIPAGEFSKIIKRNGGVDNAFTSQDFTAYFQRIAKDRLEMVMQMEADRMVNLTLSDKDVLPERAVVREERRSRTDNNPQSLFGEQVRAALYTAHPYGTPVIGWMSEVAQLTRKDAVDFYHKYYTPSNAILIVAGDVTADEIKKLAKKYYGVLKNTATPGPRHRTEEPEPIAARRVIMKDKRVSSPSLMRMYLAPSYSTSKDGEAMALSVLSQIIGGGATSRFYKQLVIRDKVAASASSWYNGDGLDSGVFGIYSIPADRDDTSKVEAAIDEIIADIIKNGVTEEELARAKRTLEANTIYALDNQRELANAFGEALTQGQSVKDVLQWSDRIKTVSAKQVRQAARHILQIKRSVTGLLLKDKS